MLHSVHFFTVVNMRQQRSSEDEREPVEEKEPEEVICESLSLRNRSRIRALVHQYIERESDPDDIDAETPLIPQNINPQRNNTYCGVFMRRLSRVCKYPELTILLYAPYKFVQPDGCMVHPY